MPYYTYFLPILMVIFFTVLFSLSFINLCLVVSMCMRLNVHLLKHEWKFVTFALAFYIGLMRFSWFVVAYVFEDSLGPLA